jgi:hypothetical protein
VTSELDDLEHLLEVANKVSFVGMAGGAKAEALATVSRCRNKLDALDASVINAFEATKEHRAEGQATSIGWLLHHRRESSRGASRRRRLARHLRGLPVAEEALREGRITAEHVWVLADARRQLDPDEFAQVEAALVDVAAERRYSDFVHSVGYALTRLRPRDQAERERRQAENVWANSSRTLDGCGKVDAWLDKVGFAVWQAELERLTEVEYERDRAEARDRLGREPLATELRRSASARRAAAMVAMAQRSAALDGEPGPSPFQVVVHANAELVAAILTVLVAALEAKQREPDTEIEIDLDDLEYGPDSLHELDDGTVVTVNTILLALLTGTVRGILYDPDGVPLRFGHARRLFTKDQADACRAMFRRCCHPFGCDRTGPRTQTDHVREHEDGGPTDIDNAGRRCGADNRWKHNTKTNPPPPGDTPPDRSQRRTPPDIGPLR